MSKQEISHDVNNEGSEGGILVTSLNVVLLN